MAITTRARLGLFLSLAVLLVAGIAGAQYVGATSTLVAGSEPSGGGGDGVAGICIAPAGPEADREGPPPLLVVVGLVNHLAAPASQTIRRRIVSSVVQLKGGRANSRTILANSGNSRAEEMSAGVLGTPEGMNVLVLD